MGNFRSITGHNVKLIAMAIIKEIAQPIPILWSRSNGKSNKPKKHITSVDPDARMIRPEVRIVVATHFTISPCES